MPRFDRTGPEGNGPKTGWRMGRCMDDSNVHPGGNEPKKTTAAKEDDILYRRRSWDLGLGGRGRKLGGGRKFRHRGESI
jgi:hypothetical protein